jgi:hypothetical protein
VRWSASPAGHGRPSWQLDEEFHLPQTGSADSTFVSAHGEPDIPLSQNITMFSALLSVLYYVFIYPFVFLFWLPYYFPTLAMPFYVFSLLSVGGYLLIIAIQNFVCENIPVDLKKKYKAEWALVTGASSGTHSDRVGTARKGVTCN